MKRKFIECDVCKRKITKGEPIYKFKEYGSYPTYCGDIDYCNKLDMCAGCYDEFVKFINKKSEEEHDVILRATNKAFLFRRQVEDEAVKEFVDYLKSTQVSKMDYMGSDYIAIEDIELAEKEFEEML